MKKSKKICKDSTDLIYTNDRFLRKNLSPVLLSSKICQAGLNEDEPAVFIYYDSYKVHQFQGICFVAKASR